MKYLWFSFLVLFASVGFAKESSQDSSDVNETPSDLVKPELAKLKSPMYTPFVELYVLEELKHLRSDMASQKHELMQQILDREHASVDRAVEYSTDTVTYFFYLIAAATSVLVLVGWNSLRDIKERVHSVADEEISNLIKVYEGRLNAIEEQLQTKAEHIKENKEEIELTNELQSLWLKAAQDPSPSNKIVIYDQILALKPDDCEAYTYKADSALDLNEPQWAVNLCNQALALDEANIHAKYQLACAYAEMGQFEESIAYLTEVVSESDAYKEEILSDRAFDSMRDSEEFVAKFMQAA